MKTSARFMRTLVFVAGLAGATMLGAASPASETKAADKLLDRWVEAMGGARQLQAQKTAEYQLRMIAGNGFSWTSTAQVFPGGYFRVVSELPNGQLVQAYDGKLAWQQHAALGAGLPDQVSVEQTRRESDLHAPLHVKRDYSQRRRLPDDMVGGHTRQVVEFANAAGPVERWYFSATTGLRVAREVNNPQGVRRFEFSDFRKIEGVIEPFKIRTQDPAGGWETQILGIRRNVRLDARLLLPPDGLVEECRTIQGLLDRHLEVSGGIEALRRLQSRVTKAKVEITSAGIFFETTLSQKAPNLILLEQEVPGMGLILQGFDGRTAWAWAELQGYRELQGPEMQQLLGMADLQGTAKLREHAPFGRLLGERVVNERKLLAVELGSLAGSAGIHCFDLESGYLVQVESVVQAGPSGSMKVVMSLSDYRDVEGLHLPFLSVMTNPAMTIVTRTLTVENNVILGDALFRPRKNGEPPEE